jgi:hypothetical protein
MEGDARDNIILERKRIMRTAEEWLSDPSWCDRVGPNTGNFTNYGIEAIQHDASKGPLPIDEGDTQILPTDTTAIAIRKVCNGVAAMLIRKNNSYGDSALKPIRVFSKADSIEAIKVRLDDKLSRLMRGNGDDFGEDVIDDIQGYLVLLKIARARKVAEGYVKVADEPLRRPGEGPSLETTREPGPLDMKEYLKP